MDHAEFELVVAILLGLQSAGIMGVHHTAFLCLLLLFQLLLSFFNDS